MSKVLPPKSDKAISMRHLRENKALKSRHANEHKVAARSASSPDSKKYHMAHAKDHAKDVKKIQKHMAKVKEV